MWRKLFSTATLFIARTVSLPHTRVAPSSTSLKERIHPDRSAIRYFKSIAKFYSEIGLCWTERSSLERRHLHATASGQLKTTTSSLPTLRASTGRLQWQAALHCQGALHPGWGAPRVVLGGQKVSHFSRSQKVAPRLIRALTTSTAAPSQPSKKSVAKAAAKQAALKGLKAAKAGQQKGSSSPPKKKKVTNAALKPKAGSNTSRRARIANAAGVSKTAVVDLGYLVPIANARRVALKTLKKDAALLFKEYQEADPVHLQADTSINLDERLQRVEAKLKYKFKHQKLLCLAMMHLGSLNLALPSHKSAQQSQVAMMWIGDTLLHQMLTEQLLALYPTASVGQLNKARITMITRAHCARRLTSLGLDKEVMAGRGLSWDVTNTSLLGETYEAVLGAIYFDGGLKAIFKFFADTYTFPHNIEDNPLIQEPNH